MVVATFEEIVNSKGLQVVVAAAILCGSRRSIRIIITVESGRCVVCYDSKVIVVVIAVLVAILSGSAR